MGRRKVEIEITAKDKASKALKGLAKGALAGIGVAGGLAAANLAATLGRELIRTAKLVLTIGAGFEKSMSGVKAITRGTAAEMAAMEKVARNLGKSTVFTANNAAEAMEQFSLAGFSVNETLRATPAALDLAAAGQLSMGEAANITSNVLRQFNIDATETTRVVDVLAGTATTSNQTVRDIGEAMKFAGITANALGVTLEETAALLGTLADRGMQASMGGTALRRSFAVFMGQLEPGEEGLKGFNAALARNEDGSFSFSKALDQLRDSGITSGDVMKAFGQRAGPAMVSLLGVGGESIAAYEGKIRSMGGVAKQVGEDRLDNLSGDLTELTSAMTESALLIFNEFAPALRAIVTEATDVVRWVNDSVQAIKDLNKTLDEMELENTTDPLRKFSLEMAVLDERFQENTKRIQKFRRFTTDLMGTLDSGALRSIIELAAANAGVREQMDALIAAEDARLAGIKAEKDAADALTKSLEGQTEARKKNLLSSGEFQGPQDREHIIRFDEEQAGPPRELFDVFVATEEAKREQIEKTRDAMISATLAITTDAVMRRNLQLGILEEQYEKEKELAKDNTEVLDALYIENLANRAAIEAEFIEAEVGGEVGRAEASIALEEARFLTELELLKLHHADIEGATALHDERMLDLHQTLADAKARVDDFAAMDAKGKLKLADQAIRSAASGRFEDTRAAAHAQVAVSTAVAIVGAWEEYGYPWAIPVTVLLAHEGRMANEKIAGAKLGFAQGGLVTGGTAGIDSVPALLTPGEVVIPEPIIRELNRVGGTRGGTLDTGTVFSAGGDGGSAGGGNFVININGESSELDPEEVFGADMLRDMAERLTEFVKLGGGELTASHLLQNGVPVTATDLQS